jgi:hypothetical protein
MKFHSLGIVTLSFASLSAYGQKVTPADEKLLDSARSRYYDLMGKGLISFHCAVKYDLSTLPATFLPESAINERRALSDSTLSVEVGRFAPRIELKFPKDADPLTQQRAKPASQFMTSIVSGFFQTWPSKGWQPPIPPFTNWVDRIVPTPQGYTITAKAANGLDSIDLSKDLLVTRILSIGGKVDEHPTFLQTPEGLIFSANDVVNQSEGGGSIRIKYEIQSVQVDGFRLPSSVHLKVNDNVDVRFSLNSCTVEKGIVVKVKPAP